MAYALGRSYTDEEKQLALSAYAACRNDAIKAAKFCKDHYDLPVSHDQINRWAKGDFIAAAVRTNAIIKQGQLADKFEEIAHLCVDLASDKLTAENDIPLEKLMTAAGIATDKSLVLRGQANNITQVNLTPEDRLNALEQLRQSVEERLRLQAQEGQVIDAEFESEESSE